ncbi:GGDEF domain-containing protein [Methylomicrobium sp. RS1]|jgi:diguanylate cyclase (GGDEF)-like protein|uniref:GGDEF domain-containing protein n=1 Tax=Candidatus Methylomicrobium oryzae TaxID=2802053 RepID=UPI001924C30A|nr:GGDEF domain-containing protein [Methylomicrobium sp. RS1]MBL1263834.1 GGDEF domain-containing protein [Methylomicrobium sp. RS1]
MNSSISTYKSRSDAEYAPYRTGFDTQTGFANRALFISFLSYNLLLLSRNSMGLTLLDISLNNFKWIDENYGPATGDQVLADTARRLLECARHNDSFARLSEDEFGMLLPGIISASAAELVARQILAAIQETFVLPLNTRLEVACSIGIATYPHDSTSADGLLHNACVAMNQVKLSGRHGFAFSQCTDSSSG